MATNFTSADIRNIALVGHGSCGKTALGEAMLFNSGATSRLGSGATSVLDFEPEEQKRGGSIASSFAWLEHDGRKINIIDTPGDQNFVYDSFAAMLGADMAVVVVSAPDGVEVQTEAMFNRAVEQGLPRVIVINKMDRERADPVAVMADIESSLGVRAVPLQVPIGREEAFSGVVSLLQRKALTYKADGSGAFEKGDVPAELADQVESAWENLVESVASTDDDLLEKYLETFELSEDEVKGAFRAALSSGNIVPVLYTAAASNMAVHALMDLISWAGPHPMDRSTVTMHDDEGNGHELTIDEQGPLAAQVIHTFMDEFSGKVTIFRVFSGTAPDDGAVVNSSNGERERLGSVYAMRGKERTDTASVLCGDILAAAKLKNTRTNDTLQSPDGSAHIFPPVTYPDPMMSYIIMPDGKGAEGKLKIALERLIEEDPTLSTSYDELSHQLVLQGMGQAHLDMAVEKLRRKFKVQVATDLPAVPYRETLAKPVHHIEGKHKKQTGGAGQFGVCYVDIEPLPRDSGFEFVDKIFGGSIPKQYVPSVEKGVRERMARGYTSGYPIVDIRVTLTDGKYHPVDSKDVAFQMAGSKALQQAFDKGGTKMIEPVYRMEIIVPSDYMGDVMSDITSRRGRVLGMDTRGKKTVVQAVAPLAEIQRYAPDLRAMTSGKGTFVMSFEGYEDLPSHLADKVMRESPFRQDHSE